jgi:hypothetical protein
LFKLSTDRVSPALREIRQREEQWEEEESQTLIGALSAGERTWPGRSPPRVLPYCGLGEQNDRFFLHEWKDAGERCNDFAPSAHVAKGNCADCRHRSDPPGPDRDYKDMERIISISRDIGGFRGDSYDSGWGTIKETLNSRSERLDTQKSAEMLLATDTGGEMPAPPEYYATCKRFSGSGRYALCNVRNYHGYCLDHSERGRPSSSRGGTERPSGPRRWSDGGQF